MFNRSVRNLVFGQTLSNLADVMATITIVTLMYHISNSVTYTALVPLVRMISQSISGLISPLLLDRYPLTFLLKSSQFLQFILFCIIGWYAWQSLSPETLWVMLLLIMVWAFLDGWTSPATSALIPRLLDNSEHVLKANGVFGTANQIVQLAGWAGGAIVFNWLGGPYTLLSIAVMYFFAFLMTSMVHEPKRKSEKKSASDVESKEAPKAGAWQRLREGWLIIWSRPALRSLAIMDFLEGLAGSVWAGAFLLAYVKTVLHRDETWWGYINVSYFIGAIIGGLCIVAISSWLNRNRFGAMMIGMIGYGVLTLIFGYMTSAWIALALALFMGPLVEMRTVAVTTIRQLSVEEELLPKVLAAMSTLNTFIFGISVVVLGVLSDLFGIAAIYVICGLLSLVATGIGYLYRQSFNELQPQQAAPMNRSL
ncbi:MFS transporter [Paenibacillus terrigena]|uniref:MFS transporter n=1 Tax=Paenibacillus terrigena TaxID=369333 RepID=UPI0003790882|nr:MFS transporter [Paenibacillus terrigena]